MLSFEISAIDIVLLIAVIVLLVLFITQKTGQVATKSRLHMKDQEKLSEKPKKMLEAAKEKLFTTQPSKGFKECVHDFGYLRNLPQNTPVPDECFGCPKVMRCLFPNEQDQIVH